MPLGTRDIMMVVRARDLASHSLRNIGTSLGIMGKAGGDTARNLFNVSSALMTVGIGFAAAGGAGVFWLNSTTDAAMKYNQEAAKTLTQVDQLGVGLEDIKDIARDVAREIPAPFEQMQTALYDIFSSMDVTVGGARLLLGEFSRAAVAGQVDLQDAARGTIGILNAYELGAEGVNRVNDVMFQLVRKGVGTYGEFANVIGMAVPAAARAGQRIEDLAGMMAFLTRNGLSTSSAAAAAGRALENLAHPDVIDNLEDMGVKVKNASGEFRPMVEIVEQLQNKFDGLTAPQRAKKLQDLLRGAGNNVQARRFWNLAVQNAEGLRGFTENMLQAGGELDKAYDIMFEAPQSQIQLLKNNYEVLKTEIGDELLPVKLQLARAALRVLEAWNSLSDGTKSLIIKIVAIASVFALVFGVVLTLVGGIGMVIATLMSLGMTIGGAIALIGGFAAALIAIPVLIFLIIKHFDTIKKVAGIVWNFIKDVVSDTWHALQRFWDWLSTNGVKVWHAIKNAASGAWQAIQRAWEALVSTFKKGWQWIDKNFGEGFKKVFRAISGEVGPILSEVGETLIAIFDLLGGKVKVFVDNLLLVFGVLRSYFVNVVVPTFAFLASYIKMAFDIIMEVVKFALTFVKAYIETVLGTIVALWRNFGGIVMGLVKAFWNFITTYVASGIKIISNLIQLFLNIFQGDWSEAWNNVKNILKAAWDLIKAAIKLGIDTILILIRDLPGRILGFLRDMGSLLYNKGKDVMNGMFRGMINIADTIWDWIRNIPGRLLNIFRGAKDFLFDIGKAIIRGLWNGMKDVWGDVTGWLGGLPGQIIEKKGPPAKDARILLNNGKLIMQGLQAGMEIGWRDVQRSMQRMTSEMPGTINTTFSGPMTNQVPTVDPSSGQKGYLVVEGDLVVREEAAVDDLDWWTRTKTAGV